MGRSTRWVLAAAAALVLAFPAAATAQDVNITAPLPDYVASDNVELIGRIKTIGDGVGAKVLGNRLFVTTTLGLAIYDITDPEQPTQEGFLTVDVEFENEEVPTNGKILGISGQIGCKDPTQMNGDNGNGSNTERTGCLSLYDVSEPSAPRYIRSVSGAGQHTAACVLDCQYFYGSTGAIVDARDPENATLIGDWRRAFPDGTLKQSCHHVREIRPGYLLGSCQPIILMSVLPEDGGSIEKPVILATGSNKDNRFQHSSQWPRDGRDRFMFSGGETNAEPECTDEVGAFQVWDATSVIAPVGFNRGSAFNLLSEVRPMNGNYADGRTPVNGLGCSVHWFQHHPEFRNGGLVALAEYENGTRFLQITPDGKIVEQGFFLPLAGSTSAPHWSDDGKVVYNIDYTRGLDILRWKGETYVPTGTGDVPPTPGGTGGTGQPAPACASAAGFSSVAANPLRRGLRFVVGKHQDRAFDVEVLQASSGRSVLGDRLRVRFRNVTEGFDWNGRDSRGRRLSDGFYVARFRMRLDGGARDIRRVVLERRRGTFRVAPDFTQRTSCGTLSTFALSSPVFGGRKNKRLGISYRLTKAAQRVTVEVRVGKRVVRRIRGGRAEGRLYRYSVPARRVARGKRATVRVTVDGEAAQDLVAKRL